MILLVDNYDSFVHNLARYFECLGHPTHVVRNDVSTPEYVGSLAPQAIVLSPGPCTPHRAGYSMELVKRFTGRLPLLGVCLGHQAIVEALGGRIVRAPKPIHGHASSLTHGGEGLFDGLPSPLVVGRYHSLVAQRESLPKCLKVIASSPDDVIMAVQHRTHLTVGLQFHPESILTEHGFDILTGYLRMAGLDVRDEPPKPQRTVARPPSELTTAGGIPITF